MLVQLYFNSQHYNAWNLKEVKPVMVVSPVNNLLPIFVASLLSGIIQCFVPALYKKDEECS